MEQKTYMLRRAHVCNNKIGKVARLLHIGHIKSLKSKINIPYFLTKTYFVGTP